MASEIRSVVQGMRVARAVARSGCSQATGRYCERAGLDLRRVGEGHHEARGG